MTLFVYIILMLTASFLLYKYSDDVSIYLLFSEKYRLFEFFNTHPLLFTIVSSVFWPIAVFIAVFC